MSSNPYMIMFGLMEIVLSQIPNFDQVWWLSIVATIMSFTYSSVGLALGIAKVAGMDLLLPRRKMKYCQCCLLIVSSFQFTSFSFDLQCCEQPMGVSEVVSLG